MGIWRIVVAAWRRDPFILAIILAAFIGWVAIQALERLETRSIARDVASEVVEEIAKPYVTAHEMIVSYDDDTREVVLDIIYTKDTSCERVRVYPEVRLRRHPWWIQLEPIIAEGDLAPATSEPQTAVVRFPAEQLDTGLYEFRIKSWCRTDGEWLTPPFEGHAEVVFWVPEGPP